MSESQTFTYRDGSSSTWTKDGDRYWKDGVEMGDALWRVGIFYNQLNSRFLYFYCKFTIKVFYCILSHRCRCFVYLYELDCYLLFI